MGGGLWAGLGVPGVGSLRSQGWRVQGVSGLEDSGGLVAGGFRGLRAGGFRGSQGWRVQGVSGLEGSGGLVAGESHVPCGPHSR